MLILFPPAQIAVPDAAKDAKAILDEARERMKKVQEPILALKEVTPEVLAQCEELGAALAAGLALGIY